MTDEEKNDDMYDEKNDAIADALQARGIYNICTAGIYTYCPNCEDAYCRGFEDGTPDDGKLRCKHLGVRSSPLYHLDLAAVANAAYRLEHFWTCILGLSPAKEIAHELRDVLYKVVKEGQTGKETKK